MMDFNQESGHLNLILNEIKTTTALRLVEV